MKTHSTIATCQFPPLLALQAQLARVLQPAAAPVEIGVILLSRNEARPLSPPPPGPRASLPCQKELRNASQAPDDG